jgi:two-component system OmpR family response regulator
MDADASTPLPAAACSAARASPLARILLVDDDAEIRQVVARGLRGAGYVAHCAEDGEAGWEALRADPFDALITDHEMPRLTGLDLIRRVRAAPLGIPVILMSGRLPWDDASLFPLLTPGMALKKPFTLSDLLTKLRCVLIPAKLAVRAR